jgi:aldehyde dehydrogenase (NAD+)
MSADLLRRLGVDTPAAGVFSAGGWHPHADRPLLESRNPADGSLLGRVATASPEDYEQLMRGAVEVAAQWRSVPAPRRGELVRLVAAELRASRDDLGRLVTLENGKILAEGIGEVQEMIDIADLAVGQSRMLYGLSMHSERPRHRMFEQWHPLGVVGVITAFNFPVAVWAWNAFLAAVCGNVTVWKPSPHTPLCALAVQQCASRVAARHGFPPVFQLFVDAGNRLAEQFVADRRVALLSFTGSTAVGREVGQRVAARLGRSLLELGGNNAVIVDESADLALTVPAIVFGAVGTAGQRCTSTRRVLVHEAILPELERRLKSAYAQVAIGDPQQAGTLMGPLISEAAVARYEAVVNTARAAGAELVCGGRRRAGPGHFVEPTIFRARNDAPFVQEETFAPILWLIPVRDIDEAIALQNAAQHGLSSAIFTERLGVAERFLSAEGSDCGIANVNVGTSGAEVGGAFGGEKDTGGGRESGSDAWRAYMRRQTCTINGARALALAQGIRFDVG